MNPENRGKLLVPAYATDDQIEDLGALLVLECQVKPLVASASPFDQPLFDAEAT